MNGSVCVGIVQMFMIAVLVTVPIAVPIPAIGVVVRFAIGLLAFGRLVRPQAEPSQEEQPKIEEYGASVPPIGKAPDQRQGVHGPIKAERVRAKEKPKVDGRQVGKG